jgi:translation elongation factor EF-Tu-like GTPase
LNSVDGAIYPVVSYEADVNMFSPEKGGRQVPFFSNYRPNILVSGEAVPAEFILTNKEMVSPGETAKIIIKTHNSRSLSLDQEFEIQDGVHVVGSGTITKVL